MTPDMGLGGLGLYSTRSTSENGIVSNPVRKPSRVIKTGRPKQVAAKAS